MDLARPLRSVFADLAGGRDFGASSGMAPEEVLAAHGHPDLPEGLVAEAVVNYADTAPYEVAEHLAPYVRAHTAVPQPGGDTDVPEPHWFDLLTTAPTPGVGGPDVIDAEVSDLAATDAPAADAPGGVEADIDGDFGRGDTGSGGAGSGDPGAGDPGAGDIAYGHRGPIEDAAGPAEIWPADPTVGADGLDAGDMGTGIDLRPTDEAPAPGEDPDAIDGA